MRYVTHLVFILSALSLHAQNDDGNLRAYTAKEGLSNNYVSCLLQDSRRFLWVGTKEGLNRFDGHGFKTFFSQQKNLNSLADNFILDILEYSRGQLLIATNNGMSVLNTLTGKFENEKIHFPALKAGSGTIVSNITETGDGKIWINHNGEIDLLDSNLNYLYRFTDIPWAKALKGSIIKKDGHMDSKNRLWFVTDTAGIQIIDFASKQVWNYKNNPQHLSFLSADYIYHRSILLDTINNILWYAPWGRGLFKYDLATNKEQHQLFGLKNHDEFSCVNTIIQKDDHHLLCAVGNKLFEVDINTLDYKKIADKTVGVIFLRTKDNHIWEGTDQGIIRFEDKPSFFSKVSWATPGKIFLPDECTSLTITKNGSIYATYRNNALVKIEKNRTTAAVFKIPGQNPPDLSEVCEDKEGQLWVGTSKGVFLFDTASKKFFRPPFVLPELSNIQINLIYCDNNGDIWIGTRRPFVLFRINARQKSITKITNAVINRFTAMYEDSRISRITEDSKNNLWMTSYLGGGIINYNKTSGQWKIYPESNRHKTLLVDKGLISLYADDNNNLWCFNIYSNTGLICYNYLTDSVRQFSRDDGLASDYLQNMIADRSGNLWLSSDYGLTQFNIQNRKTVSYNLQNTPAARLEDLEKLFDSVTNSLVYALGDHLLFIEINRLKKNIAEIIPFFDKVTVNNKEFFIDAAVQKPVFNYDENNISIEFTGVDFSNIHNIRFAYQLSGLDTGWRFPDISRSAQYSNLPPGNYIFKVKTANENIEWDKAYDVFAFSISPVFWKTAWFQMVVILFVALIIIWLVRRRIQVIRREAELKLKLSETEMVALRSQMNPHFIFNCLNAIDNLIQTNQADKATTYLARFAKLIRSVLESSKSNTVTFDRDFQTLHLFLELEQFRCNNKFVYEMQADQELLEGDYKVPPLIIQPFVENAIHHGLLNRENGERKVTVRASLENNCIIYSVQDNGVGRMKAQEIKEMNKPEHRSYGIQITSERIHLHNQNGNTNDVIITDLLEEGRSTGTMVKVTLKIH